MTDWSLAFHVPGEPASKARARGALRGNRVVTYTPESTVTAQATVGWAAREAGAVLDGMFDYGLTLTFRAATWQRRDIDNLSKLVLDALTGVVWEDDSQVRELRATLDRGVADPGVTVAVYRLSPQRAPQQTCPGCGKRFRRSEGNVRFCGALCKTARDRLKRSLACEICGTWFVPGSKNKRRTCSDACAGTLRSRLALDRWAGRSKARVTSYRTA